MVEARRFRRVLLASGLSTQEIARALRLPASSVEQLLAGRVRLLTFTQAEKIEGLVSRRARKWLRGSRRYEGLLARTIPAELVIPLIEEALGENELATVGGLVGVPVRSLFRILHDNSGVSFFTADRIVTGLVGPAAWQEPPLRGWYFSHAAVLTRR